MQERRGIGKPVMKKLPAPELQIVTDISAEFFLRNVGKLVTFNGGNS